MRPLHNLLCIDKNKLLDKYEKCANAYSSAVTDLRDKMGVLSQPEYQALYEHTEELRMRAREAQDMMLRHIAQHGC
jgi:hypothetical protein